MSYRTNDARIYIGNLPPDIRSKDIEDIFLKYGKIVNIDLKNRKGPPFAFVEFDDPRDAEDAVYSKDGYNYDGYRLRVEFPRGARSTGGDRGGGRGGGGGRFGNSYNNGGSRGGGYSGGGGGGNSNYGKRTGYRVLITGLPPSGSWQDIKDHMREAGDVVYADVFKDGTGVVEYATYDAMRYAIKKLDDTKFTSHEGETAYIRVKDDSRKSSRSGSREKKRSRSRSGGGGRAARASPSYSPAKRDASLSVSRSKSRSPY